MRTTVTNAQFDAALAAVPAPYGPLTRTGTSTNLDVAPTVAPNSNIRYHVKSAAGADVYISYEDLSNTIVRDDVVKSAHGYNAVLNDIKSFVDALSAVLANVAPLAATPEQYTQIFRAFQAMPQFMAMIPHKAWVEVSNVKALVADFAAAISGLEVTLTNNSDQEPVSWFLWDFGDGATSQEWTPPVHTYALAGSYDVTLTLIGPDGISTLTDTQVVA